MGVSGFSLSFAFPLDLRSGGVDKCLLSPRHESLFKEVLGAWISEFPLLMNWKQRPQSHLELATCTNG